MGTSARPARAGPILFLSRCIHAAMNDRIMSQSDSAVLTCLYYLWRIVMESRGRHR
ncbi:hypothetical protein MTBUT4_500002 [Magnetospirillum sp. UT-4]|nr:hypothetical protein MTBUT4_500002 [Magnetospirillum sp. UT-4]